MHAAAAGQAASLCPGVVYCAQLEEAVELQIPLCEPTQPTLPPKP